MEANKSVGFPDAHARVRFIYAQQLQVFLDMEYAPRDAHEVYQERVRELELQYAACPHYLQSDFLENHARKHTADLLARKDEILQGWVSFHEDVEFVDHLKQQFPHLYLMSKWEVVTLALAEKHEAATRDDGTPINEPPKKKLTPEEWRAKQVRRQQVKIEDKIAFAKARLESLTKARQLLDEYDLDELNLGEMEQELTADILAPEEEDCHLTHKSVLGQRS